MNLTNETYLQGSFYSFLEDSPFDINGVVVALLIVVALLAVFGNSLIVTVYLKCKTLQDSTSNFIINLGLTDLTTGLILFVTIVFQRTGLRQHSYISCLGTASIIQYLALVSHSLILAATFERYIGICKRDIYNRIMTKRGIRLMILCTWVLPFPVSFMPLFGFNYWMERGCVSPLVYPKWILSMVNAFHFLQTALSMALYFRILARARDLRRKVQPGPMQGINTSNMRYGTIRRSLKSGRVIAIVTVIFFASWLPFNISIFLYCVADVLMNEALSHWFRLMGMVNSVMNPFLFAWQKRDLRNKLKSMLTCKKEVARPSVVVELATAQSRVQNSTRGESLETANRVSREISEEATPEEVDMNPRELNSVSLKSINLSISE